MTDEAKPIHPAATVILVRDGADGLETLLLRRNAEVVFHGGSWVFPGGRIDPADYPSGMRPDDPTDPSHEPAARAAAVREAFEEAGLAIDVEGLVPFAHWTTPAVRIKRFATWFFLGAASEGTITVDGSEITDHAWMSPAAAVAARDEGTIELPPPTYVSLVRLAASSSVADALAEARRAPYLCFEPRIRMVEGGFVSIYPGDVAYDDEALFDSPGPRHRLWAVEPVWQYELEAQ